MAPSSTSESNLTPQDIRTGAVLINPENNKQYRVDRIDGDTVHCVLVEDSTQKATFNMDKLKNWRLGKKAA